MKAKQGLIVLAVILGILLIGSAIWGFRQNNQKNQLTAENEELTTELSQLQELKQELTIEVDSLQEAYTMLAEENESLSGSLSEVESKLASTQRTLSNVKSKSASEINDLRVQIEELINAKTQLQTAITGLQAQNDSLRTVAGILTQDLNMAREENQALSNLNNTIQDELKQLTLANFKASAFRVDVEQRNDKVTSKARRARAINVSFDLTNVPDKYQGLRTLYLAVTDDQGVPIQDENPIQEKVVVNNQAMDLIAVQAKEVNVAESQRLTFNHELDDKLKPGYYRVAVYTDIGLLGASSFALR